MFALQLIIFTILFGWILFYLNSRANFNEEKFLINFSSEMFFAPVLILFLGILTTPFLIQELKITTFQPVVESILKGFNLNSLIITITILTVLCGFYTVAFWRKNKHGK